MRSFNFRNIIGLLLPAILMLIFIVPACREEPDPLDRNRAPETYLTIAPPETSNAEYRVHLYWHGEDRDGIVTHYMWYRSDTLRTLRPDLEPELDFLDWNPEARKDDYLAGNFTSSTDTVIIFTGFDATVGAKINRQAFHIVAIDDGGRIDETPARIQFFARVPCVPEVEFWFESENIHLKKYVPGHLDTISMFEPFCVNFLGSTCNNIINGYQWLYGGNTYPIGEDGVPGWYIPAYQPPETIEVCQSNRDDNRLPEGDFYFRVRARDEAGAISNADIVTGEGIFQVVINHDPDTDILFGENFYTDQDGIFHEDYIDFDDGIPDTLPYHSRLRMHYLGWDDPRDSLEYTNPPVPIRFQFKFERWGYALNGGISRYNPLWVPEKGAEDTNCNSDEDTTTMRIGTFDYNFYAKSFDEQYRYDHTPDTVSFVGNFPPTLDEVAISFDSIPFRPGDAVTKLRGDTIYISIGAPLNPRGADTVSAVQVEYDPGAQIFNEFFTIYLTAGGHDDRRDPPGSGVYGWYFSIDAEEEKYYSREEEWIAGSMVDSLNQALSFRLIIPVDPDFTDYPRPDPDYVNDQPLWMGDQDIMLRASDMPIQAIFKEGMRSVSPTFVDGDPCNEVTSPGEWEENNRGVANYGRSVVYNGWFYIKLVY